MSGKPLFVSFRLNRSVGGRGLHNYLPRVEGGGVDSTIFHSNASLIQYVFICILAI